MLILRGIYKSGIIVDQKHEKGERYTYSYKNELYLRFVTMLLNDPVETGDILLSVEWVKSDSSLDI